MTRIWFAGCISAALLMTAPTPAAAQSARCTSATNIVKLRYAEWQRLTRRYCPAKGGCQNRIVLDAAQRLWKAHDARDRACGMY